MKRILYGLAASLLLFNSCEKDNYEYKETAHIMVINAAVDQGEIKVNPGVRSGINWASAASVAFGANSAYGSYTGNNTITVVSAADTTKTLFQRTVDLKRISTLYIAGQAPAVDTILRTESNFPTLESIGPAADQSMYMRFVNLSPNSPPLKINLVGSATSEATGLAYKGITAFKKYAALLRVGDTTPATPDYEFEIRNADTDAVLGTFTVQTATYRYKTISVVIKGLVDGGWPNMFNTLIVSYN